MLTFPFTAIRRPFANTGSDPASGLLWVIGSTPGGIANTTRPPFEIADSDNPGDFTVTATVSGDVVHGTVDFDSTFDNWVASAIDRLHISLFAGPGGFDDTPGASNDWYVARFVNSSVGQCEIRERTVYINGPSYTGSRIDGNPAAPEIVTSWDWILPDATTASGQSTSWESPTFPASNTAPQIVQINYVHDYVTPPGAPDPVATGNLNYLEILTDNIAPVAVVDPVALLQETGDVTLNGANSYDPGYKIGVYAVPFGNQLIVETTTIGDPIAAYLWEIKDEGISGSPVVDSGALPTITLDLDPGTYRVYLTVTDTWGGQDIFNAQNLYVPDRLIGIHADPGGILFTAVEEGNDTKVYRFDRGVGSRELRATLVDFVNPVLGEDARGVLTLGGRSGPDFSGHFITDIRTSFDGGRSW